MNQARPASASVPLTAVAARNVTGSTASVTEISAKRDDTGSILKDPNEAYRGEVISAQGRDARPQQLARDRAERVADDCCRATTIAPPRAGDSGSRTRIMRLRGSDLAAYLARQITRKRRSSASRSASTNGARGL